MEAKKDTHQDKIKQLEFKAEEYLNNWKRAAADFANYKKEEIERMALLTGYAREDMLLKILPILDNLYLSEKQLPQGSDEWTKGFLQIKKQFEELLKKEGVEEIKTVGQMFDPNYMEAVEEVPGDEPGKVIEELQKGYLLQEKVLRPAKVKISK